MMNTLFYLLRWLVFLIRWVLYAVVYGALEFLSKPGSRIIMICAAFALAWRYRLPLDGSIGRFVQTADLHQVTETLAALYTATALGLVLVICVCTTLSRYVSGIALALRIAFGLLRLSLRLALLAALVLVVVALAGGVAVDWTTLVAYALFIALRCLHMLTTPDALLVWGLLLVSCVYVAASRLLTVLLGAFPPVTKPLRPLRGLRTTNRPVRPVVVRLAVPKLPRRREAAS